MDKDHQLYNGILETIGHTPLVKFSHLFPEHQVNLYGKMEMFNPGGSIKDRTALNILRKAIEEGYINDRTTVIESSSGNMAIGLAQLCLKFGLHFIAVVDSNINAQTLKLLKTYGADIEEMTGPGQHASLLEARLARVKELLLEVDNSFWTNQYANKANPQTHEGTMQEVLNSLDHQLDYLLVATSTCGTLMGCADYLKAQGMDTKVVAVDAVGSLIFQPVSGERKIPGHGAGRKSRFLEKGMVDQVIHIDDMGCVTGCNLLLQKEAILAGGSSGAIVSAMIQIIDQIPRGANCVMILSDGGERYLDTIYSPDWVNKHFHDPQMELAE